MSDRDLERDSIAGEMVPFDLQQAFKSALHFQATGKYREAIELYRTILQHDSKQSVVHYNLGIILKKQNLFTPAAAHFQQALELNPDLIEAANNLGNTLHALGRLDEAIDLFEYCKNKNPAFAEAYINLGVALKDRGEIERACDSLRHAVSLRPENPAFRSNLIYALHYHPGSTPQTLLTAAADWGQHYPEIQPQRAVGPKPFAGARVRVGYISPFFHNHGQSVFIVPLFAHHDRTVFEIFCFSDDTSADATTKQLKACVDHWRDIRDQSAREIANYIREDKIDILIDLGLHTAQNYLSVFALMPAPLQISWLGYPGTTGLKSIAVRLTDPWLDPPGEHEADYIETSYRLPHSFWCYDPLTTGPSVNELPAIRAGYITFGCLNNFSKVNSAVLQMWASVLSALPQSRMIVMTPLGKAREQVIAQLQVDPARITFVEFSARDIYLRRYREIDLCLDTYPYNGHTTSLDALWMGVPVVTRCGETAVSRAGYCFCANLGLEDLVAKTSEEFVATAIKWANDIASLKTLRSTLRTRMEVSPLMDAAGFARDFESALLREWQNTLDST